MPDAGAAAGGRRHTAVDVYRTVASVLTVAVGVVILARTLPLGLHPQALLVGLGFVGLGAYRLSFMIAYLRRRKAR
jgi:uncharacterized membrane protein